MAKRKFKSPPLTFGKGINDSDYVTQDKGLGWVCPFFLCWKNMMKRAYSSAEHARRPSYIGTTICEEWHSFMAFKAWMLEQDWQGKQLDKDLLFLGNKEYRPDRCCFVSQDVNAFLIECNMSRGDYPIGVYLHKITGKYAAQISAPGGAKKYLGLYETVGAAHESWVNEKHKRALFLASLENNPLISSALSHRYLNYHAKQVQP